MEKYISTDALSGVYLAHFRTKGSKNGDRLYQNKDGTYTELGKERRREEYARTHGLISGRLKAKVKSNASTNIKLKKRDSARIEKILEKRAREQQKVDDEKARLRDKIVKHPGKIVKYGDLFSEDEVQSLVKDIEFHRKLKDIQKEEIRRGLDMYKMLRDGIKATKDIATDLNSVYGVASNVHNAFVEAGKIKGEAWPEPKQNNDSNKSDKSDKESNKSQENKGTEQNKGNKNTNNSNNNRNNTQPINVSIDLEKIIREASNYTGKHEAPSSSDSSKEEKPKKKKK